MGDKSEVDALVDIITGEIKDHERRIGVLEKSDVEKGVKIDHLTKTLDKIDNNTTWAVRLIIGSIVTGALGLLFVFAKGG